MSEKTPAQKLIDGTWLDEIPDEHAFWLREDEAFYILIEVGNIANCTECRELLKNDMICDAHAKGLIFALRTWKAFS